MKTFCYKKCTLTQEHERWDHGTRQDKKTCGDAEAATREGGDEAAGAQTSAEERAGSPATLKTSSHEVPAPKPVGSQFANCELVCVPCFAPLHIS